MCIIWKILLNAGPFLYCFSKSKSHPLLHSLSLLYISTTLTSSPALFLSPYFSLSLYLLSLSLPLSILSLLIPLFLPLFLSLSPLLFRGFRRSHNSSWCPRDKLSMNCAKMSPHRSTTDRQNVPNKNSRNSWPWMTSHSLGTDNMEIVKYVITRTNRNKFC